MKRDEDPQARALRVARLAPLGLLRLRLLSCLGGDNRFMPQYLPTPGPEDDVFAAYRAFVQGFIERYGTQEDAHSLVAAARLITGEISAADDILNTLRADLYRLDHGAGYCIVLASWVLAQVLPLPKEFPRPDPNYVAGSPEDAALRAWLAAQRDKLVWHELQGVYSLA